MIIGIPIVPVSNDGVVTVRMGRVWAFSLWTADLRDYTFPGYLFSRVLSP